MFQSIYATDLWHQVFEIRKIARIGIAFRVQCVDGDENAPVLLRRACPRKVGFRRSGNHECLTAIHFNLVVTEIKLPAAQLAVPGHHHRFDHGDQCRCMISDTLGIESLSFPVRTWEFLFGFGVPVRLCSIRTVI